MNNFKNEIYEDFILTQNYDSNILIKEEIPFFIKDVYYSVGNIFKVKVDYFNTYKGDDKQERCKKSLNSLFYLNREMTIQQLYNIYNVYSKINGFPQNLIYYKDLYDRRKDINRLSCNFQFVKVMVNINKLSNEYNLPINSKEFKTILVNWYRKNARIIREDYNIIEVKSYILEHLNSFDMCIEKVMKHFKIKDKRTINKYLKQNNIIFNSNTLIIDGVMYNYDNQMDYIIKKNIRFYLKSNLKIDNKLLLDECKYYVDGKIIKTNRTELFRFFKVNQNLKDMIDKHNKTIKPIKKSIIDIDYIYVEPIEKTIKTVNSWGKVTYTNNSDYLDIFESIGIVEKTN